MTNWIKNILKNKKEEGLDLERAAESGRFTLHDKVSDKEARTVRKAVERTVKEYGEALKRLGNE